MSNPHNLKIGQKLFVVPTRGRGSNRLEAISKVGRLWATLEGWGGERVCLETLAVDGGEYTSPAVCSLSEEDYTQEQELNRVWGVISARIYRMSPRNLSIETVKKVASLLGIDITKGAE